MRINITIDGEGSVSGAGEHLRFDKVSLLATPSDGYQFRHFRDNNATITANPYAFTVPSDSDIAITAVFFVTIESYLRGRVGFNIPDSALMVIRKDRGLTLNQDVDLVDNRLRQLSYADVLMYGASLPSQIQGTKRSDFGWSEQDASSAISITDKADWRKTANAIYKEFGDKKVIPTVVLSSLNGRKANDSRY